MRLSRVEHAASNDAAGGERPRRPIETLHCQQLQLAWRPPFNTDRS
jgi:hypothetical protein